MFRFFVNLINKGGPRRGFDEKLEASVVEEQPERFQETFVMNFVSNKILAAMVFCIMICSVVSAGWTDRVYVDNDANGLGNGSSWEDAFVELRDAIDYVRYEVEDVNEIWVAAGGYSPGEDGTTKFEIPDGLKLYGGFAGGEDFISQRDIRANETFLFGDPNTINSPTVLIDGSGDERLLSGFTITDGRYGVHVFSSSVAVIDQCVIEDNSSHGLATNGSTSITIKNCIVRDNKREGVWLYNAGNVEMVNCWVYNNGFASGSPEGVLIENCQDSIVIRNCTIAYNDDMGIYVDSSDYVPVVKNCILWGNNASGTQLDDQDCNVTYSCVQGGAAGNGNISDDPDFAYVNDIWGVYSFRLMGDSPCVDTGDTSAVGTGELDIDLQARIENGDVDMGGDEFSCEPVWVQGDLDGDGIVAIEDIQIFMYSWMTEDGTFGYNPWCDFDGSDFIDLVDFHYMAQSWQNEACWYDIEICVQGDFDCSGVVDLNDFTRLAGAWLTEPGMENWDPDCDLDGNMNIETGDLKVFAGNWIE
jgi:parallel beta-helix repeat protein